MDEKFVSRLISVILGLYLMVVIGNVTTGIINDAIDKVIPEVDKASAALLGILRFVLNFDGALIMTVVCILIWLLTQWKKSE
jgi:hypothetical protein